MKPSPIAPTTAFVSALLALPQLTAAFYLPGVAPTSYKPGDAVPLYVNSIKPVAAKDFRLHSVLSYDHYDPRFKFCLPDGGPQYVSESLGSILFGDRIMTSPFNLKMAENETCMKVCSTQYDTEAAHFVNTRIMKGFALNWLVDGLPAGQNLYDELTGTNFYSPGFALGQISAADPEGPTFFNNHYDIIIEYHKVRGNENQLRVVGAVVEPSSKPILQQRALSIA